MLYGSIRTAKEDKNTLLQLNRKKAYFVTTVTTFEKFGIN